MAEDLYAAENADEGVITEVIRPAAIIPDEAARLILAGMEEQDVTRGGEWIADTSRWSRYDGPWSSMEDPGGSELMGTIQIVYGMPTRYEITLFRATITQAGSEQGWTVVRLCDEALGFGGLDLASCPRASLNAPPKPFHF